MKIVLFVVAVFVLLWLLRGTTGQRPKRGAAPPPSEPTAREPQTIVACAQCGVHLPRDEALPGRGGVFCGDAHRAAFEEEHP
ncbi:MAG: PP0621 family protein [Caldimonas sp.]